MWTGSFCQKGTSARIFCCSEKLLNSVGKENVFVKNGEIESSETIESDVEKFREALRQKKAAVLGELIGLIFICVVGGVGITWILNLAAALR